MWLPYDRPTANVAYITPAHWKVPLAVVRRRSDGPDLSNNDYGNGMRRPNLLGGPVEANPTEDDCLAQWRHSRQSSATVATAVNLAIVAWLCLLATHIAVFHALYRLGPKESLKQ